MLTAVTQEQAGGTSSQTLVSKVAADGTFTQISAKTSVASSSDGQQVTSVTQMTVEDSSTDLTYNPHGKTVVIPLTRKTNDISVTTNSTVVTNYSEKETLVAITKTKTVEIASVAKWDGAVTKVSSDADNRLTKGTDGGLYVSNALDPDPLAYYILAKA
jgi:hypothetical protein